MAKKTKDSPEAPWASFGFVFVGSLIFLWLVFMESNFLLSGAISLWQPLLYTLAVLGSLVLFLSNFGKLTGMVHKASRVGMKANLAASFGLIGLTFSTPNPVLFAMAVLGFVLAFIGTSMPSVNCMCDCE